VLESPSLLFPPARGGKSDFLRVHQQKEVMKNG